MIGTDGEEVAVVEDEGLLVDLLNSTPVVRGSRADRLVGDQGVDFCRRHGGEGSLRELNAALSARDDLQQQVRAGGTQLSDPLARQLAGVSRRPVVTPTGLRWTLHTPPGHELAVRAVLAWCELQATAPGRLRPCANDECHLYLVDHTRPGTAKWCSMGTCGNRMKARAHARRHRDGGTRDEVGPLP